MSTETKGEPPVKTGDIGAANVTADGPPSQQRGPALAGGGAGMTSADGKEGENEQCKDGHPVDVFSGAVVDEMVDLAVPGLIPVEFKRSYNSSFSDERTGLGAGGWTFSLNQWLELDQRGLKLRGDDGRFSRPPAVDVGATAFKRSQRLDIRRPSEGEFRLYSLDTRLEREFRVTPNGHVDLTQQRAWLRAIRDRRGNTVRLDYENERLIKIVDTAQREFRLSYDAAGRITRVQIWVDDVGYQHVDYTYSDTGELAAATNALGYSDRYEYDGKHRMVKTTLKNGVSFYYRYDQITGQCIKTWGDGGLHTYEFKREYRDGLVIVTSTGADEPRVRTFNAAGDLLSERNYAGDWEKRREYDDDHLLLVESNAAGETTRYEYDERGNRTLIIDPAGNQARWVYCEDLATTLVALDGLETRFKYTGFGDQCEVAYPTGVRFTFEYDRWGRLSSVSGPEGPIHEVSYDQRHAVLRETDGRHATWCFTYDAMNRLRTRTDPLGSITRVEHDSMGRASTIVHADGSRTRQEYDPLGNVSRVCNQFGEETQIEYSGTGVVSKQVMPDGATWSFSYDTSERIRRVENPNAEAYEFFYDAAGRVIEERAFDGRIWRYSYDRASRLRRIDRPDRTYRGFDYDCLGNMIAEESSHGRQIYERDNLGRLRRAIVDEGETITVEFSRDRYGRVIKERQGAHELAFTFDERGRCVERIVPGCGTTTYGYDVVGSLGELQHVSPEGQRHVVTFERDMLRREVQRTNSDGRIGVAQSYDVMSRMIAQKVHASKLESVDEQRIVSQRRWQYDAGGRVIRVDDQSWGATQYRYDRGGQLVSTHRDHLHEVFEYQPNGSLRRVLNALSPDSSIEGAGVWDIQRGNLLRRTDRHEYEYDECHRRVAKVHRETGKRTEYVWDCRDRLREVRFHDGTLARYSYDAFGRRVRKELYEVSSAGGVGSDRPDVTGNADDRKATPVGEGRLSDSLPGMVAGPAVDDPTANGRYTAIEFLWDADELAAELHELRGPRGHVHYPGTFVPLLQVERGEVLAVITDPLGVPLDLVSEQGSVQWRGAHSSWGRLELEVAEDPDGRVPQLRSPFGLLGQYHDEESGLAATRFRYWDPDTGRWCSPDPLGLSGSRNPFGFDGVPTMHVDPLGLMPWAWNPDDGMGHHLVPRGKANSAGLPLLGTERNTPTFFPVPYSPGDHETIHRAQRPYIGPLQGPWTGTPAELVEASRTGLKDVAHLRGDLKIPATGEVIARNVTPEKAHEELMKWHAKQLGASQTAKTEAGSGCKE